MSKHTPGPWHVGMRSGANSNTVFAYNKQDQYSDDSICSVYGLTMHTHIDDQRETEGLANANLIAAGPDLLEALQAALDVAIFPSASISDAYEKARAAIKKATGEA